MSTEQPETEEKAESQNTTSEANAAIFQRLPLLGQIAWLYSQSIHHKHLFIGDIDWLIIPPLMLDQCKLYMNDNTPVAFVSWVYLNPDAEARFLKNGIDRIPPKDWNNGHKPG
jgi:cytolysin-activating lysine-acyltransferase